MSTIRDVAREAGVSTATVSRVFNNSALVDEETRHKVNAAVRKLNYVPHPLGRGLSSRRTDTIGLLLPDLNGEFFSEVLRGADATAQQSGYHLLVSSSHGNRDEIGRAIQTMNGRVDALLVMSPDIDAQTLAPHLPVHHPVVLMNCRVDHELYDTLAFDNYGGAVQMMKHILHHGHKHIAFLSGRRGNLDAEERLRGYLEAMKDSGLPHSPGLVIPGEFSEASGYEAAKNVISLTPRPTAILAANDSIAIGALSALREAHILVPEDVALTGFDDIPVAAYLSPALTTVHLGIRDLGIRAMEIVLDALQHEEGRARQRRVLSTTLKIRESCGCKSLPHRAMDREGRTGRRTG